MRHRLLIIARKDSPNGKRYVHKDGAGAGELAFGFSFAPLIERASEIGQNAEAILAQHRALKVLRDQVSVVRREIAAGFDAAEQTKALSPLFYRFRASVDAIPRRASCAKLTAIKSNFEAISEEIANLLENGKNAPEVSGTNINLRQNPF